MQAMAPGSRVALQAGQTLGVSVVSGGGAISTSAADGLVLGGGAGGGLGAGLAAAGAGAVAAWPRVLTPATAGSRFAGEGTVRTFLHRGQRTCLPAALSATWIDLLQCGQR